MKQETLEEAFDKIDDKFIRYSTEESEFWTHYKIGVMDGLQYKQERSYSEEEVIAFGEFIFKHILLTHTRGVKSLFEQFKKK